MTVATALAANFGSSCIQKLMHEIRNKNMYPVKNASAAWVCVYYLGLISARSFGLGMQSGQFITQERFKTVGYGKSSRI